MPKLPINRIILTLTVSDIFSWGFYYCVSAIVGVYLAEKLDGDAVEYIGIGTSIYMLTRAACQIPVGYISDRIKHYSDEAIVLAIGNVLMGLPFILYPLISSPYIYYVLQFILGVGTAMNLVNWRKLFARNLDKNREGRDYAIYETIVSVCTAVFSVIIGFIGNINQFYFDLVIFGIGVVIVSSCIWPLTLLNKLKH